MISKIRLKFGRTAASIGNDIDVNSVTIFVGPNNSGKSKILSEIDAICRTGAKSVDGMILDEVSFSGLTEIDAETSILLLNSPPHHNEHPGPDNVIFASRHGRMLLNRKEVKSVIQRPASNPGGFAQWFLRHLTLKLDGPNRIHLVDTQSAGDLQKPSHTTLATLFRDNNTRATVRRIIKEAFGLHFVIDPTNLGHLRIRLSSRSPANEMQEKGIHDDAIQFHAAASPIEQASDGVKAFIGIMIELYAGDPKILLVDEPEAFLHPSLASKLGYEIARATVNSEKRVFASTHSPAFVMGCIQSGAPVNLIRLTYRSGVATARLLPSHEILEMMRNPLLRSTNVLNGLFYEFVVVTESDTDRAFYQEANERLLRFKPDWGIPNCLFLNAQNKQTIPTILRPLRKLGIPAASIVDVDILKEGGTVWTNQLDGINMPSITQQTLAGTRSAINSAMQTSGKNMKRDGGKAILDPQDREACEGLFGQLADYGLFVVEGGELESWLKQLEASGHGPHWLISVFEKMGEDPDATQYVKPTDGDVWKFLSRVKDWLTDPHRRGIPA